MTPQCFDSISNGNHQQQLRSAKHISIDVTTCCQKQCIAGAGGWEGVGWKAGGTASKGCSPSVAVVHGTEHLLEDTLCLLFLQLCSRLQHHISFMLSAHGECCAACLCNWSMHVYMLPCWQTLNSTVITLERLQPPCHLPMQDARTKGSCSKLHIACTCQAFSRSMCRTTTV